MKEMGNIFEQRLFDNLLVKQVKFKIYAIRTWALTLRHRLKGYKDFTHCHKSGQPLSLNIIERVTISRQGISQIRDRSGMSRDPMFRVKIKEATRNTIVISDPITQLIQDRRDFVLVSLDLSHIMEKSSHFLAKEAEPFAPNE